MAQYILSDPNMSDGTHPEVIEAIMDQLRGRDGMKLIGYEPDADFDRLPAEILGRPEVMREALLDMAGKAYELIDMEQQHGRHPRVGAVDTIEVYPAKGITIDEVREFCEDLGQELYKRYEVPVYFTGKNARRPGERGASRSSARATTRASRRPCWWTLTGRRTSGRRSCTPRPAPPSSAPSSSTTPTSTWCSTRTTWRSPGTWPPVHPQHHRRLHQRPGDHRPAADAPPHRQEGRRGVHRDQQPAADAHPPRVQPGARRGRPLRRERHRRADLRHHRRRGAGADAPSGTSSSRPSTARGTTRRRSSRTTCWSSS